MACLWSGLRRDTIGGDLQIYIEQDRTVWFLEVETGRPIDKQFGQGTAAMCGTLIEGLE
jgi:hypothetical protein